MLFVLRCLAIPGGGFYAELVAWSAVLYGLYAYLISARKWRVLLCALTVHALCVIYWAKNGALSSPKLW